MSKRSRVDVIVVPRGGEEALATGLAALREHGGYHRLIVAAADTDDMPTPGHGVAIVPSDAVVTEGWLDKLVVRMESVPDIGIVSPLTTQAVPIAAEYDADAVAAAAELASAGVSYDVACPGPVMLIRSDVVARIGLPDRDALREYAARARELDCRIVVCDDAYVATAGARTDESALAPIAAMLRTQLRLALQVDTPGVLHVVHPRGGGTEKYIRELIAASGNYRHYFLRIDDEAFRITEIDEREPCYEMPRDRPSAAWLRSMCAWLRVGLLHVHSLVGSGDDLVQMIADTALPYCYSVHDMYLPCPSVYLIKTSGEYCNATTDPAVCRACLTQFGNLDTEIERWRDRYRAFLAGASRVYAPSHWARDTLLRYYPEAAVTVAPPHEEPVRASSVHNLANVYALPDDDRRNVGILGAIGPEKGARNIDALAARIRERELPLRLVVVGYTDILSRGQSDDGVLTVHGVYARDEIEALLDAYRISLILFPTVWPETFSYTLSESWMAGRPVVVPPRGALAERVEQTGAGWTIDDWPDVDAMLDQLLQITDPARHADVAHKSELARAVFHHRARALVRPPDLYGDMLSESRSHAPADLSRYDVYVSACHALGVAPR